MYFEFRKYFQETETEIKETSFLLDSYENRGRFLFKPVLRYAYNKKNWNIDYEMIFSH